MRTDGPRHGEPDEVVEWRRHLLARAGVAPEIARAVAHDERYDLHELLRLLDTGCPPSLALDITAPLEDRRVP